MGERKSSLKQYMKNCEVIKSKRDDINCFELDEKQKLVVSVPEAQNNLTPTVNTRIIFRRESRDTSSGAFDWQNQGCRYALYDRCDMLLFFLIQFMIILLCRTSLSNSQILKGQSI